MKLSITPRPLVIGDGFNPIIVPDIDPPILAVAHNQIGEASFRFLSNHESCFQGLIGFVSSNNFSIIAYSANHTPKIITQKGKDLTWLKYVPKYEDTRTVLLLSLTSSDPFRIDELVKNNKESFLNGCEDFFYTSNADEVMDSINLGVNTVIEEHGGIILKTDNIAAWYAAAMIE